MSVSGRLAHRLRAWGTLDEGVVRTLFYDLPDSVIFGSPDRIVLGVNPAASRIFGYDQDEFLGLPARQLYVSEEEYLRQGKESFDPRRFSGRTKSIIRYRRKDGSELTGETTAAAVRNDEGELLGFISITRDISEETAMQHALQQLYVISSDQRRSGDEKIRDIMALGLGFFGMKTAVVGEVRDGSYHVLHVLPETAARPRKGDVFPLEETQCSRTLTLGAPLGFCSLEDPVLENSDHKGGLDVASYIGVPLRIDGLVFGTLAFVSPEPRAPWRQMDLDFMRIFAEWVSHQIATDRAMKRRVESCREAERQQFLAVEANKAKTRFLASVSHELRTPMTGVMGMLDLLESTGLTPLQKDYVRHLRSSGDMAMAQLNDLLDLSKIEADALVIEQRPFDIAALVRDCAASFEGLLLGRPVALRVVIDPALSPFIVGDRLRLRQVLGNLIMNAVKFTDAGFIEVRAVRGRDGLTLEVEDSGPGIAPDIQEKMFEPFQQVGRGSASDYAGTGLGLAIVRRLVNLMGGTVGLRSSPGKGSLFRVSLPSPPAAAPAKDGDQIVSRAWELSASRALRILVAEDNRVIGMLLETMLERWGHSVDLVSDGRAALRSVADGPYDCAILDMHMPELDGMTASLGICELTATRGRIPIIALTADPVIGSRAGQDAMHFAAILPKPIDWRRLYQELEQCGPSEASAMKDGVAAPDDFVPMLDEALLAEIFEAVGVEHMSRMLDSFGRGIHAALDDLALAVQQSDPDARRRAAHSLKGQALGFGANRLVLNAEELEHRPATQGVSELDMLEIRAASEAALTALTARCSACRRGAR